MTVGLDYHSGYRAKGQKAPSQTQNAAIKCIIKRSRLTTNSQMIPLFHVQHSMANAFFFFIRFDTLNLNKKIKIKLHNTLASKNPVIFLGGGREMKLCQNAICFGVVFFFHLYCLNGLDQQTMSGHYLDNRLVDKLTYEHASSHRSLHSSCLYKNNRQWQLTTIHTMTRIICC